MTQAPHNIAVLYSRGPHLIRLLHFLRKTYINAVITLYLPEGYPERNIAGLADEYVRIPLSEFEGLRGRLGVLWQIRSAHADMLVIMFPSVKLKLFTTLSGAKSSYWFSVNGEFREVEAGFVHEITQTLSACIQGYLNYLKIKAYIARQKVGK